MCYVRACKEGKEANVLFNDTLNTFYFTVIWRQVCMRVCVCVKLMEVERDVAQW